MIHCELPIKTGDFFIATLNHQFNVGLSPDGAPVR